MDQNNLSQGQSTEPSGQTNLPQQELAMDKIVTNQNIAQTNITPMSARQKPPVLLIIVSILLLLQGLGLILASIMAPFLGIIGLLIIILAIALFKMKIWAFWSVIVLVGINLFYIVLYLFSPRMVNRGSFLFTGIILSIMIIIYLWSIRKQFK